MPQKQSWRFGWQDQNLARFMLYRFSFLAEPIQVADDIGIDYFCTIFETKHEKTNPDLIPKNSFAIQVKSKGRSNEVDLTGYLPYLESLELPFFIGIIDRIKFTLTIYSGELLPSLFAFKGKPSCLKAKLCERSSLKPDYAGWLEEPSTGNYILLFPMITEIAANMDDNEVEIQANGIFKKCSTILDNLASYRKKEFLLKEDTYNQLLLFTRSNWTPYIQENLFLRLSEMFYHLFFMHSQVVPEYKQIALDLFPLYERIYLQLANYFTEDQLPSLLLTEMYNRAKNQINSDKQ